jgi:hypothetical protein
MPLTLVICDFHLDPQRHVAAELAALPQLPALAELLRRGRRTAAAGDWRSALATHLGAAGIAGLPPAVVASRALPGVDVTRGVCFATPVHRVAGMSRVRLHPAGLLRLEAAQVAALCQSFESVFAAEGLRLHPIGDGLLLECRRRPPLRWILRYAWVRSLRWSLRPARTTGSCAGTRPRSRCGCMSTRSIMRGKNVGSWQ